MAGSATLLVGALMAVPVTPQPDETFLAFAQRSRVCGAAQDAAAAAADDGGGGGGGVP